MVPLDSLAVRSLRSWLGEPSGPGVLALHHALAYQRPGLWGDHPRVPRSVVLVREGDDQLEAFGAGEPEPAVAWLAGQGRAVSLVRAGDLARRPWHPRRVDRAGGHRDLDDRPLRPGDDHDVRRPGTRAATRTEARVQGRCRAGIRRPAPPGGDPPVARLRRCRLRRGGPRVGVAGLGHLLRPGRLRRRVRSPPRQHVRGPGLDLRPVGRLRLDRRLHRPALPPSRSGDERPPRRWSATSPAAGARSRSGPPPPKTKPRSASPGRSDSPPRQPRPWSAGPPGPLPCPSRRRKSSRAWGNTVDLAVSCCGGMAIEHSPPLRRGGKGGEFRPKSPGWPRSRTPLYPPFVRGDEFAILALSMGYS